MICEHCQKAAATTFLEQNINGYIKKMSLCSECAKKLESSPFGGFDLSHFWGGFLASAPAVKASAEKRCEDCGSSFSEIVESGKAGCPACYRVFYRELLPSLERIHGKAVYNGKIPAHAPAEIQQKRRIETLRASLSKLVEEQKFEQAAEIRDEIKRLEGTDE